VSRRQRSPQQCVPTEPIFLRGRIKFDKLLIDPKLIFDVKLVQSRCDQALDVFDRF
jgi:hypothetical protein